MSSNIFLNIDANDAKFYSLNKRLIRAIMQEAQDAIYQCEETPDNSFRYEMRISDLDIPVDFGDLDTNYDYATRRLAEIIHYQLEKQGYSLTPVTPQRSFTISWGAQSPPDSPASASYRRYSNFISLKKKLDELQSLIYNEILNGEEHPAGEHQIQTMINYPLSPPDFERSELFISNHLKGYTEAGFSVIEGNYDNNTHHITISW